jgi:cytochrome P450
MNVYLIAPYHDCVAMLKVPRLVSDRSNAVGKSWWSPLVPRSLEIMFESMVNQDDPQHKRLRRLVHKAFTPRAVDQMEGRIEGLTQDLLDKAQSAGEIDLIQSYALPIPVTVIAWMLGVEPDDIPAFSNTIKILSEGMTGWNTVRTVVWDIPKSIEFLRGMIARKRQAPRDDVLTGLIQAEEGGDKLTEEELVSMTMLLLIAGHETTVHLITHAVVTLLEHPEQLRRLQENPDLIDSAIEEVVRFAGPVHSTETNYAREDITLHGVTIPKGAYVYPLLGAANRDPKVFENPDTFDITRSPNHHLGFGQGIHYCLGAPLARMEAKIAVSRLFQRFPNMRLAVKASELEIQRMPLFHRYKSVPLVLAP